MKNVVGVNYSDSKKIYYFLYNNLNVKKGNYVIVETEQCLQFAQVVTDSISIDENKFNNVLKCIVRIATDEDINQNEKNIKDAYKALKDAIKIADSFNLDMKIFSSTFSFDRKQLLFNFLADERIDFRELAKKLASIYKTRIELRQIGVRDKAKCIGGYGQCGRKLCCGSFMNEMNSVSINMAKNQNLALNPQKINGVCGRLMCCLSFENDMYDTYKKDLPKVNDKIKYKNKDVVVTFVDIFRKMYRVEFDNGDVEEVYLEE